MRIAKFISNAGYCSRREAEKLISKKKVYINKKICEAPNINVMKNDHVTINGNIIKLNRIIRLWKMYKPTNVICTNNDPKKRKTIFELLPKNMPRTIDIDILVHGSTIMETKELIIPHPGLINRKFVLIPFDEIATDFKIPHINLTVNELLGRCADRSMVRLYELENKA